MASDFSDSNVPYGNKFDVAKRFSKVLFRPGRPAFSSELLETQSILQNQLAMLGNSLFQEGAVISGMDIIPLRDKPKDNNGVLNSFTLSSLFADNLQFKTSDYTHLGRLVLDTEGHMPNDIAGLNFSGTVSKGLNLWVTFNVRQLSGSLNKISMVYNHDKLDFKGWNIKNPGEAGDGTPILTAIDDITSRTPLVTEYGQQIKLNDGNEHRFVVQFTVKDAGAIDFKLVLNGGYDITQNPTIVYLNKLYIQQSQNPVDEDKWQPNPADLNTPSAQERVRHYRVNSGRVYLNGIVREFDQQDIWIKGVGTEQIGLRVNEDVITSVEDPSLLDDTPNAVTHGEAGADRLHYVVVLTYNDASATPFITFEDNVINPRTVKPDYSNLEPILAKRTYDQSGSFRTSGFEAKMRYADLQHPERGAQDPTDANKILLTIEPGQAYVRGYSINTTSPTTLKLDTATTLGKITNEGFNYTGRGGIYYPMNQPVRNITGVSFRSRNTVSAGHVTGGGIVDTFVKNTNVVYINKVWDGKQEYHNDIDFTYSGNQIYWGQKIDGTRLDNAQVPTGTYQVTYEFNINATEKVDYKVVTDPTSGQTGIDIDSMSGNKPIPGTSVEVTYDYFQARIDMIRITMDQSDPFKVVQGQPASLREVTPPTVHDPLTLELGYVLIKPNSHEATFTMQTVTRITFNELQQWGMRLTNVEMNAALDRMAENVKRSEDPVVLKDAFADSFATIDNRDDINTTAAYDFEEGTIYVPSQAQTDLKPSVDKVASNISIKGHIIKPPFHEDRVIEQPLWTGLTNINEFNVYIIDGDLTINPSVDNWIESSSTTAFTTVHDPQTLQLHKWWRHLNDHSAGWYGDGRDPAAHAAEQRKAEEKWDQLAGLHDPGSGNTLGETGWMIQSGGSTTTSTAIEHMRQQTISFTATNMRPAGKGYKITMGGHEVLQPKPASVDYDGGNGTFQADVSGVIKGSFYMPAGLPTGVVQVEIKNARGDRAVTNYSAQGTHITTTNIIEKRIYDVNLWDPLAQSFYIPQTRQLSSIDLYFGRKPGWDSTSGTGDKTRPGGDESQGHVPNVIVQIREVGDQGYPTNVVRSQTTLSPDQVQVSTDGSAATRVVFPDPITLHANQGYAIILISESDKYWLFTAKAGEKVGNSGTSETAYFTNPLADYNTDKRGQGSNVKIESVISAKKGDTLTKTPNTNGDLFISNNAQTWSSDGAASLKFRVNCAHYDDNGVVEFDPIILSDLAQSNVGSVWQAGTDLGPNLDGKGTTPNTKLTYLDRLAALTSYLTYQNTSMHWFIRILQGSVSSNPRADLAKLPYKPLNVINNNQVVQAPGTAGDPTPRVTSTNDPQQIDGEVNLFQNASAVQLKAVFDCDKYIAPLLTTENLSLAGFLTGKKAVYESVDLDESDDAEFNVVKLQYDGYLPTTDSTVTKITPFFSIDGGASWYNFPEPTKHDGQNQPVPAMAKKVDKNDMDASVPYKEKNMSPYYTRRFYLAQIPNDEDGHEVDQNHLGRRIKFRIVMTSNTNFRTPRVRKLAGVLKRQLPDD